MDPALEQESAGVRPTGASGPIPRRSPGPTLPAPNPAQTQAQTQTQGAAAPPAPAGSSSYQVSASSLGLARRVLATVPAWLVSLLVHLIAFIALALIVTGSPSIVPPLPIRSSVSESLEELTEFEVQEMATTELVAEAVDPAADLLMTTAVTVEPVEVASLADDVDAAPLSVELTDFGLDSAAPSDMLASIGAIGGEGGGLGGRGKAGALARSSGGGADTEAAVERSLSWFLRHQLPDGGW